MTGSRAPLAIIFSVILLTVFCISPPAHAVSDQFQGRIYDPGSLKPIDSQPKLKVGDKAPDFTLASIFGEKVSLGQFAGKKKVVLSFVPAAWTPVCSEQWPGYNVVRDIFEQNDTILLGITTDHPATLYSWTEQMGGVWFPVLSDFWPHGQVSDQYGVLRSTGTSERALFLVDKQGTIQYIDINDINERPSLELLLKAVKSEK